MKINKSSWHYFLLTNGFSPTQDFIGGAIGVKTLCPYFWMVVLNLFLLGAFCSPLFTIAQFAILGKQLVQIQVPFVLFGLILWGVAIGWVLINAVINFIIWLKFKTDRFDAKDPKPDGLMTSYIKAKKQKTCPILEFTDRP